ncbi:MAG: choice-of-anchor O protein, partial [Gammaproteobacteria bacterium]|nr:choice-of-anchor O protein [Gammaproteobacteria bacterium]
FKEGIMNQGGPADIQSVRVATDDFNQADDNPYRPENLVCENKWWDDGSNAYYPYGLCMLPTINLSGMTPIECEVQGLTSDGVCPDLDLTCVDDANFGQLCISTVNPEDEQTFDKMLSYVECPGANGTGTYTDYNCDSPTSPLGVSNLDDAAWYMPLDVSKAHRGFIDGDFVMMLYAKSPNWKLNRTGRDRYELYQRRSFDGGVTWTVTPGSFQASNGETYSGLGTTTCETWRKSASATDTDVELHNCTDYQAGDAEQSRNMSQLATMRFTILDPRYSPNAASMAEIDLSAYGTHFLYDPALGVIGDLPSSDIRRPDRHFIVYEDGDNSTVAVGEAEPLNLTYGRAFQFGDHFQVWYDEVLEGDVSVADDQTTCYPSDPNGLPAFDDVVGTGFCNEFDTLEGSRTALSEEASVTASAAGDFLYSVWGQINLDNDLVEIDGNAQFRRVWFIDGWMSVDAYAPGAGQL